MLGTRRRAQGARKRLILVTLCLEPFASCLVGFAYLLEIVVDCVRIYGLGIMKIRGVPPWYPEHSVAKFHENEGFRDL